MHACMLSHFSHVQLFGPHELYLTRLFCPWDSPGKNTGVDSCALLQVIFPTQEYEPMSPVSPALQAGSLPTKPPGKSSSCSYLPTFLHWYIYWFHLFINQTKHAFSKFCFCLFFLLLVMKSHRLSFSWAIFSQLGKAW